VLDLLVKQNGRDGEHVLVEESRSKQVDSVLDNILGDVEDLSETPLHETVLVVEHTLCDVDLHIVDLWVEFSMLGSLHLEGYESLQVMELDGHASGEVEDVPKIIIKVDLPFLDNWDFEIDNIGVIGCHPCEVKCKSIHVNQEWVGSEVEPVEVEVEWEKLYWVHAKFWPLNIKVQIGGSVMAKIFLDHVGQGLGHAHFQTWLL